MKFIHPALADVFQTIPLHPSGSGPEWAWAQNVVLEQQVTTARQQVFEEQADAVAAGGLLDPTPADSVFQDYHDAYLKRRVFNLAVPGKPIDTFHPANQNAMGQTPGKRTALVRLDDLAWPMQVMGLVAKGASDADNRAAFNRLCHAFQVFKGKVADAALSAADAQRQLGNWLDQWNNVRDTRPVFAAPLSSDAVKAAFGAADGAAKAAALRDLLGLGHLLPPERKGPVFAILWKYEVGDVLEQMGKMPHGHASATDVTRAFAAPTVLDGPLYPWFFPSPPDARVPGTSFGRTVHLDTISQSPLAVELLHPPFPYQPRDIHDIVEITDPGPSLNLHAARAAHVAKVRGEVKDATAFGAPYY